MIANFAFHRDSLLRESFMADENTYWIDSFFHVQPLQYIQYISSQTQKNPYSRASSTSSRTEGIIIKASINPNHPNILLRCNPCDKNHKLTALQYGG